MTDKKEKSPEFKDVNELLHHIQTTMKAPKGQYNSFGKYKYRSCEDIQEAVKKHLPIGATLIINDDLVLVGDRYYIKAIASLYFKGAQVETIAYARESLEKKGMDQSQVTGATSSYARKYALNGLFLIDDTKDADADENKEEPKAKTEIKAQAQRSIPDQAQDIIDALNIINASSPNAGKNVSDLKDKAKFIYNKLPDDIKAKLTSAVNAADKRVKGNE